MIVILAGLAGGLGLIFMGMKLLSEHLKLLTNRRLRLSAARWTGNRWAGFVWGLIAGAVTQTMPALTFLMVGMLRSGLLSVRRALPILLGGNVGGALLLLIVVIDVEVAVLYVLGVSQVIALMTTEPGKARYRVMAEALFGMAMMVLGFLMLKESVAPLADHAWFREAVGWAGGSLLLCMAGGALLSVLVQSSAVVVISGFGMVTTGVIGIEQILMICYGACLGSSISVYLLTMHLAGRARQVAMYQVLYNCVAAAIFVPMLYAEIYLDVPLIRAAILSIDLPLLQLLAVSCILVEVTTSLFQLAVLGPAARLVERWWPTTEVEVLSKPRFIHDRALGDGDAAFRLVDLEQQRLLEILARCLDSARQGAGLGPLREAARDVLVRITEFLDDLGTSCPGRGVDLQISMLTRQRLLTWLEERVLEFCDVVHAMPRRSALDDWRTGMIEGIDATLVIVQDLVIAGGDYGVSAEQLLGGRGELMRRTRNRYLRDESSLSASERTCVLRVTSIAEHIFLLLSKLACEYELFAAETAASRHLESRRLQGDAAPAAENAASVGVVAAAEPAPAPASAGRSSAGAASNAHEKAIPAEAKSCVSGAWESAP